MAFFLLLHIKIL